MAATQELSKGGVEEALEEEDPAALKPGAAPFGNFPHYSRFHPPEQRLRLLPPELLRQLFPPEGSERRPILGLDVGCNSGVSDAGGIGVGAGLGVASKLAQCGLLKYSVDRHVQVPALPSGVPPPSEEF